LHLLLCTADGDSPRHRRHGPACDGPRGGRHHRRSCRSEPAFAGHDARMV